MSRDKDTTVGGTGKKEVLAALGAYWRHQREEFSDGQLVFRGVNVYSDSATSDSDWEIWKITRSGDEIVEEGPLKGSWDDRNLLDWEQGGQPLVSSRTVAEINTRIEGLLEETVSQLKIMNLQLSLLTDTEIINGEL